MTPETMHRTLVDLARPHRARCLSCDLASWAGWSDQVHRVPLDVLKARRGVA